MAVFPPGLPPNRSYLRYHRPDFTALCIELESRKQCFPAPLHPENVALLGQIVRQIPIGNAGTEEFGHLAAVQHSELVLNPAPSVLCCLKRPGHLWRGLNSGFNPAHYIGQRRCAADQILVAAAEQFVEAFRRGTAVVGVIQFWRMTVHTLNVIVIYVIEEDVGCQSEVWPGESVTTGSDTVRIVCTNVS